MAECSINILLTCTLEPSGWIRIFTVFKARDMWIEIWIVESFNIDIRV